LADGPNIDNEVLRIAKGLYCPVCPATPLDVCETQACVQWRDLIKQKLIAGETEEQIRAYFIAQYGERVLGAPPPEGFNLGAYILPLLLILAGGGVLFFTIRDWMNTRKASSPETISPVAVSGEYAERIARELRDRE
jgi:cytochrome c-type biogenesis protein CcmH